MDSKLQYNVTFGRKHQLWLFKLFKEVIIINFVLEVADPVPGVSLSKKRKKEKQYYMNHSIIPVNKWRFKKPWVKSLKTTVVWDLTILSNFMMDAYFLFFFVIYYYKPLTIELCPWFGWKKDIGVPFSNLHQPSSTINRELKKRRRQWERQKGNRVRLAKQQLCTFITLFVHFVAVVARLQCEREYKTTTFFFFFLTLIQSFRIQLQKKFRTFDELNEME